jgi:hypothetical protein
LGDVDAGPGEDVVSPGKGDVAARVEEAATLPSWCYTRPEILAEENEKVFGRTWQLVARLDQVAAPGLPATLDALSPRLEERRLGSMRLEEAGLRGLQDLRSTTYERGRYSVKRESGLHHFHRLYSASMNG